MALDFVGPFRVRFNMIYHEMPGQEFQLCGTKDRQTGVEVLSNFVALYCYFETTLTPYCSPGRTYCNLVRPW
jgi:hypothetical protein